MKTTKGYVVILTKKEHKKLAKELSIMQREQLQGGPFDLSVSILHDIVHHAVDSDCSAEDSSVNRLIAA